MNSDPKLRKHIADLAHDAWADTFAEKPKQKACDEFARKVCMLPSIRWDNVRNLAYVFFLERRANHKAAGMLAHDIMDAVHDHEQGFVS